MGRYLVVANQTLLSPELADALETKSREDTSAEFILVVPATPIEHLLVHEGGSPVDIAARRGARAVAQLAANALRVVDSHVGDASLFEAVRLGMEKDGGNFDGLVISTFAREVSRWYVADLDAQLESAFHLPVTHVISIHGQIERVGHDDYLEKDEPPRS